jgi:hypothetical protein
MPTNYYQMKKHLYREKYYENKRKEQENYEFFKAYNGEREYYKQQYIKAGFLKTRDKKEVEGDLSPQGTTDCLDCKG